MQRTGVMRQTAARILGRRAPEAKGLRRLGARCDPRDAREKAEWALREAGPALGFPADITSYMTEGDRVGGFLKGFPGGSIWEIEGLFLYSLTRTIEPRIVIETGTWAGCSTRHLDLALERNGRGKMYSIDIDPRMSASAVGGSRVHPVVSDSVAWLRANSGLVGQCDLFFHDSDHSPEHVAAEIDAMWDYAPRGAVFVCHDVVSLAHNPIDGPGTWDAFSRAVKAPSFRLDFHPLSDCGLGVSRKP